MCDENQAYVRARDGCVCCHEGYRGFEGVSSFWWMCMEGAVAGLLQLQTRAAVRVVAGSSLDALDVYNNVLPHPSPIDQAPEIRRPPPAPIHAYSDPLRHRCRQLCTPGVPPATCCVHFPSFGNGGIVRSCDRGCEDENAV